MKALNQQILGDEARWGFRLLIVFCLADLLDVRTPLVNAIVAALGWGNDLSVAQLAFMVGILQISIALVLTATICYVRVIGLRWRLRLQDLHELSPQFADAIDEQSMEIVGRKTHLLSNSRMIDGNAFCLPSFLGTTLVIGGGLRMQFRRAPSQALAIIAHELAHVKNHDSGLMLVSVYLIMSYIAINVASVVYTQAWFFLQIPWDRFFALGFSFLDVLFFEARPIAVNALPLLPAAAVVLATLFLIRNREMYADEVAALHGYRREIAAVLRTDSAKIRPRSLFHPPATARSRRIVDPLGWGRLNMAFLCCIALIACRGADAFSAALTPLKVDTTPHSGTFADTLPQVGGNWAFWLGEAGGMLILVTSALIIAHHVYRAGMSLIALGFGKAALVTPTALAGLSCTLGTWLGTVFSARFLSMATDQNYAQLTRTVLAAELESAFVYGMFSCALCLSASTAVLITVRTPARRAAGGLLWLIATLLLAFIWMVPVNLLFMALVPFITGTSLYEVDIGADLPFGTVLLIAAIPWC